MNVDKGAHFAGRIGRQIGTQDAQLGLDELPGRAETFDLAFDLRGIDQIVVDVECGPGRSDTLARSRCRVTREFHAA